MLIEKGQVYGFDMLKIGVIGFIQRRMLAIDKVIVDGNGQGPQSVDQKLSPQALGKGGLARGRRTGDKDDPDFGAAGADEVGNLGDLFFMQRLGNADNLFPVALLDKPVHSTHSIETEDGTPPLRLAEYFEKLLLLPEGRNPGGIPFAGKPQYQPRRIMSQLKYGQQPGTRHMVTVQGILHIADGVKTEIVLGPVIEESHLVVKALAAENLHGLGG